MNTNGKIALAFIVASGLFCVGGIAAFVLDRATIGAPLLIIGLVCGVGYLERRCHDAWHPPVISDNPVIVVVRPKHSTQIK